MSVERPNGSSRFAVFVLSGGAMQYIQIGGKLEIPGAIETVRQACGGLNQAVFGADRETTMSGRQVITAYLKFEPVAKIEGDSDLLDLLLKRIELKKAGQ